MARSIAWQLFVDWDFDTSYTNESLYLVRASGSRRLNNPADSISSGRGIIDSMTIVLDNTGNRYSSLVTTGALYADLTGGGAYHAPMYLNVSIDGGSNYYRVFTGVIKSPAEEGASYHQAGTAVFECRSMDESILNVRLSTTVANFASYYDTGKTEAELIDTWLQAAGIAAGSITVDTGLFIIPWAWLDDESPIEDIWLLAAAAGGRYYTQRDGEHVYENAMHWIGHTSSAATLGADDYQTLAVRWDDRELYKAVTVEYAPRAYEDYSIIWQNDRVITVPTNSTITTIARLPQPAYTATATAHNASTAGGVDISSSVSISFTANKFAQRIELSITNNHTTQAANITLLQILGQPVVGAPRGEETETSTLTGAGEVWENRNGRTKMLRNNPYIQTSAQAGMIAEFLKDRYQTPRLSYSIRGVPGNPQRELGDRITINDSNVMSAGRDAFVTEISFRLSNQGFVQDYEALDATTLYPNGTNYFTVGTDALDGAKVLFY